MIEFNETDFNLVSIKRESKLFNLVTRYKYRVYGLRQVNNPPISIEYDSYKHDESLHNKIEALESFFKFNKIEVSIYGNADSPRIDIGLRKDLRAFVNKNDKPLLASAILSTIIYCLEGRSDLEQLKTFKLSSIPKFPSPR